MPESAQLTFPRVFTPDQEIITRYDPLFDQPIAITNDLTFKKLATFLSQADDGDAATMLQLWSEILGKDARIRSDVTKRTMALTGLEWDVVPGLDRPGANEAQEEAQAAAAFVKQSLANLPRFPLVLKQMAKAIPPNLAVLEMVWSGNRLADILPVSEERLTIDYQVSPELRIIVGGNTQGIQPPPAKFIVHVPDAGAVNPFQATLARSIATLWLAKKLAFADWVTFAEIFGMPVRLGHLGPNPDEKDKSLLSAALRNMGSAAWGMIKEGMDITFQETASRSDHPAKDIIEYVDRTITIGLLGGNLTSDTTGGTGTFSAIKIQDQVRRDIVQDDAKNEARTLEEQLFTPMVRFRFPGKEMPIPRFQRVFHDPVDQVAASQSLLTITRDLNLPVTKADAYRALGMEAPERDASGNPIDLESLVQPAQVAAPSFPSPFGG